jgi:RND family efflux transporter MFP subunit
MTLARSIVVSSAVALAFCASAAASKPPSAIHGTGTIEADKTTAIGSTVDGILEAVLVEVGDRVRRGQPLFRLRDVDYRLRVERDAASAALAEAELAQSALDLARTEELRRQNVVSADRLDAASTAHRMASAKLERARAELASAEQNLRDTTIVAPYDGVITRRLLDEGALVRATPGTSGAIVELQKVDTVIAVVRVPEVALSSIEPGMPAVVRIDGLNREYRTTVHIVNDQVDASAHTVELRLRLPNPGLSIKPGLFVEVELESVAHGAPAAPPARNGDAGR